MTLEDIVECPLEDVDLLLSSLCDIYDNPEDFEDDEDIMAHEDSRHAFYLLWQQLLDNCAEHAEAYEPAFSQMATVKYFEEQLADLDTDICVHYANSSAVRLACIYAQHYVWCNRGVNGIEDRYLLRWFLACYRCYDGLCYWRSQLLLRSECFVEQLYRRQSAHCSA